MSAALGGQVLLSQATYALVVDDLPQDTEGADLGEHVLRDLSRAERVFQIVGDGLSSQIGALRTVAAFPTNLPAQPTSFVGRARDIELITGAFVDRRVVTITGVGGVGKTRLALQVGADLLPRFPHGVWLCELASATDEDSLFVVVAATLQIKRAGVALDEAILDSIKDKHLLLVLDNCEHLLSPVGELVEGALHRCPDVSVLATSREGLGVDGEQVWPLRSLDVPRDAADVDAVARSHAVQLFVDRARSARPDFVLSSSNAASVVEICRRLDGMPLAVELAAARIAAMSPSEIARRLDERFRLLTGGRRTAVERHQTLRATVDWSYSSLDDVERLVFDRLGVFAGTFHAAAASAVVSGEGVAEWDVQDALISLVAKSLVNAESTETDETRYQMLETLRQYAREQLDSRGQTDDWRRAHAQYFAQFAEEAGPKMLGRDELPWRRRVGLELDNLRAAVLWALESADGSDAELAIRIIAALATEGTMRRAMGLAHWAEMALPRVGAATPGQRAAVVGTAGFNAWHRGDYATAGALADEALREEITSDFPAPNQGVTVRCLVDVYEGDPIAAVERALHYAALFDQIGVDGFHRCNMHTTAAMWAIFAGDPATVRQQGELAHEIAKEIAHPSSTAMVAYLLGWALEHDDPDRALEYLEQSVALTRSGASDVVFANTLGRTAGLRAVRGDYSVAIDYLREAVRHGYADGDTTTVAGLLDYVVIVALAVEDLELAVAVAGSLQDGPLGPMVVASPEEVARRKDNVERLRRALGPDRFGAECRRGAALDYAELVALILARLDRLASEHSAA
jgi:predicted ATPase